MSFFKAIWLASRQHLGINAEQGMCAGLPELREAGWLKYSIPEKPNK